MMQFPEEILEAILSHLRPTLREAYGPDSDDEDGVLYRTLASICRVGRAWLRIATPLLYHTIKLPGPRRTRPRGSEGDGNQCRMMLLLLRTCLRRRDPALLVRDLKVDTGPFESADAVRRTRRRKTNPTLPHGSYETFLQDMPSSPDLRLTLLFGLEKDFQDCGLAILLVLCRNLATIEYASRPPLRIPVTRRTLPAFIG